MSWRWPRQWPPAAPPQPPRLAAPPPAVAAATPPAARCSASIGSAGTARSPGAPGCEPRSLHGPSVQQQAACKKQEMVAPRAPRPPPPPPPANRRAAACGACSTPEIRTFCTPLRSELIYASTEARGVKTGLPRRCLDRVAAVHHVACASPQAMLQEVVGWLHDSISYSSHTYWLVT